MLTEDNEGKGWQPVGRTLIRETHHYILCAVVYTQANISADHPNDIRCRRAGSRRHPLHDAAQAVVAAKVRLRVALRHTHTVRLRRYTEQGGTKGNQVQALEGGYEEGVKTRALEALPVSLSVAKAP